MGKNNIKYIFNMEGESMSNKVISEKIIYSKGNIEIVENLHHDGELTYTGKNNNDGTLRTYIQAPTLKAVEDYILCKKGENTTQERFECYAKNDKTGRWFFIGWSPILTKIIRENNKYWFSENGYRYRKPNNL